MWKSVNGSLNYRKVRTIFILIKSRARTPQKSLFPSNYFSYFLDSDDWATKCYSGGKRWKTTKSLLKTIHLISDHYCAFECEYHPNLCTHWARRKSKCLLYFGSIKKPSPNINGTWPSGRRGEEEGIISVGTRLCRIGTTAKFTKLHLKCIVFIY